TTVNGCDSTVTLALTVNPVYNNGAVQNEEICDGESFTFGGTAYTVSGSYPYTFTTVNGCDSTVTLNLTVNPVYSGGVQAESICDGESFTFGGTAYTVSGNYPFTFTTVNGCDSTVTLALTVNPIPSTPLMGSGDFEVCEENDINLSATSTPGSSYLWTGPNGFTSNIQNPVIPNATLLNEGNYQVYTVLNQCTSAVSSVYVTINELPDFTVIPGNQTVCENGTTTLTAPTISNASYLWSGPNNFTSTEQNPTLNNVNTSMAGSYSTQVSINGCGSLANIIQLSVTPTPSAPSVNSNSPVCEHGELTLSANGVANATYNWTGPNGFSANTATASVNPVTISDAGQYNVYYVTAGCTSSTATLNVAVTPAPLANFAITPQVCYGADGFALYSGAAVPGATFSWSATNNGTISGNGSGPITFNWPQSGAQSVTLVVTHNGCPSLPFTQNLDVLENITPNAGPDQIICSGGTAILGSETQPNATFTWLTPNGVANELSGYTTGSWENTSGQPITLTLTLQAESQGCIATDMVDITIVPIPVAQINAPAPQCLFGNSFDFTAGGSFTNQATFNWTFTNSVQMSSQTQNPSGIQFVSAGNQTVTLVITQQGCQSEPVSSEVFINQGPIANFAFTPGTGCAPLEVQFTDMTQSAVGISGYTWQFGTGAVSFENSPVYTYTQAGIYTVTLNVIDSLGCAGEIVMNNIIRVYDGPVAGFSVSPKIMYIDDPVTFVQDGSVGNVTSWNYTVSNGAQFYTPDFTMNFTDTGIYLITQTVVSDLGCTDMAQIEVIVKPIPQIFIPNAFTPNQYGDDLNNVFRPYGLNIKNFRMYIYNRWGELLFSTMDMDEGWDGQVRNSNVEAKQDVYVYRLEYDDRFGNPQQKIGNVTLLR
ncbi:MAG: gliding motility-associated C-terminal domain-containing protein, partial [Flavobacteriales bacterium]|nr:gliding motility-associated C-terminal domain-containing protein [Flavobacteriales bacterium]